MKKYFIVFIVCLFCLNGTNGKQASAYSVTLEKNGMYVDKFPNSIVNNVTTIFKKNVKKALQLDKKYKHADHVTIMDKVGDYEYFIPVAKSIKASDKIVIKNPFFMYEMGGNVSYEYWFTAEKNGKKLCMFYVAVDPITGKTSFWYDKLLEQDFMANKKLIKPTDTLYYESTCGGDIKYVETPKKVSIVCDNTLPEQQEMSGGDVDYKEIEDTFKKKSYSEKKKEIFEYLNDIKEARTTKKAEKSLKLQLKDDYVETKGDENKGNRTKIIVVLLAVGVLGAGVALIKRRKTK